MNHNSGVHLAFLKRNIIPGANTITDIVSLLIQVINKILFVSEEYLVLIIYTDIILHLNVMTFDPTVY